MVALTSVTQKEIDQLINSVGTTTMDKVERSNKGEYFTAFRYAKRCSVRKRMKNVASRAKPFVRDELGGRSVPPVIPSGFDPAKWKFYTTYTLTL